MPWIETTLRRRRRSNGTSRRLCGVDERRRLQIVYAHRIVNEKQGIASDVAHHVSSPLRHLAKVSVRKKKCDLTGFELFSNICDRLLVVDLQAGGTQGELKRHALATGVAARLKKAGKSNTRTVRSRRSNNREASASLSMELSPVGHEYNASQ